MVKKIPRYLPRILGPKVTAIEEAKDLTKIGLDELLKSLMTHEITLRNNEKIDESKKKKEIAFNTSSSQINKVIQGDEESDEKIAFSLGASIKYSKRANSLEDNEEVILVKDPIICFECKKSGHIKINFLN